MTEYQSLDALQVENIQNERREELAAESVRGMFSAEIHRAAAAHASGGLSVAGQEVTTASAEAAVATEAERLARRIASAGWDPERVAAVESELIRPWLIAQETAAARLSVDVAAALEDEREEDRVALAAELSMVNHLIDFGRSKLI